MDPPYLGKGFDIGIRYLRRNLHATYALFILTEFLLFKYEKSANCFSVLEERGLLFCLVNMKELFDFYQEPWVGIFAILTLVGSKRFFYFDFIHRKATVCPGQDSVS